MPSHYESFGMVALEAMACGTPVIGADVGGLSFSIQNGYNGFLVPGRDPQALAEKILLLIKHPFLRDQLGEQARRTTERYDWPNIADEILDAYRLPLAAHRLAGRHREGHRRPTAAPANRISPMEAPAL